MHHRAMVLLIYTVLIRISNRTAYIVSTCEGLTFVNLASAHRKNVLGILNSLLRQTRNLKTLKYIPTLCFFGLKIHPIRATDPRA